MSDKEYLESVENFFNDRLKSQVKKNTLTVKVVNKQKNLLSKKIN